MDNVTEFISSVLLNLPELSLTDLSSVKKAILLSLKDYDLTLKEKQLPSISTETEYLKMFIVHKKLSGRSDRTIKQYTRTVTKFFTVVAKPLKDVTSGDILYFLYTIQKENNMKDISLNNQRIYLNTFFNWLYDTERIPKNPMKTVSPIKYAQVLKKPLTGLEMEALIEHASNLRDKAMIEFLYASGCREDELCKITLDEIGLTSKEVLLHGKGSKDRKSYFTDRSLSYLKSYLNTRDDNDPHLFVTRTRPHTQMSPGTVYHIIAACGKRANGIHAYPHLIRHTMATDAIRRGMPIENLKEILGHTSIDTTLRYAKIASESNKYYHAKCMS